MRKKILLRLSMLLLSFFLVALLLFWLKSKSKVSSGSVVFSGKIPNAGETFYLTHQQEDYISQTEYTSQEGYSIDVIPNNKYKVISVDEDSITIELIKKQVPNREYYSVEPPELLNIKNSECIRVVPLAMDISQEVCFFNNKKLDSVDWKYKIYERSIMPTQKIHFFDLLHF
jgi:hypothetical protein